MHKKRYVVPGILYGLIPLLGMSLLCFVKYRLLYAGYYQSDIFLLYQAANDWLIDKPLYTENTYGNLMQMHTYYILPLLAPFTQLFGVFGLVLAHALLYLGAACSWIAAVDSPRKLQVSLLLTLLFCGPLGFYLFDDPVYGWHMELLMLPLSVWAGAALFRRQKIAAAVLLACIVLVREDGAFQAAAVLGIYTWFLYRAGLLPLHTTLIRTALFYVASLGIFALSMYILSRAEQPRILGLLQRWEMFCTDAAAARSYLYTLAFYFTALVLAMPLFFRFMYCDLSLDWLALVHIVPVTATGFAGGFYYYPDAFFSLLWASRLVYAWALVLVFVLFLMQFQRRSTRYSKRWIPALAATLLLSAFVLYLPSFYPTYNPWFFIRSAFAKPGAEQQARHTQLQCVSEALPAQYTLLADKNFIVYFSRQNFILCDGAPNKAAKEPDLAITSQPVYFYKGPYFSAQDSLKTPVLSIYFNRTDHPLRPVLEKCLLH